MHVFYAPDADFGGGSYRFSPEESRHIVRVLRLGVGEELCLTDGRGTLAWARVAWASPAGCEVAIREVIPEFEKRPYRLTLAVAPTKNTERYEWMAEKATEIGVDRIIPLLTQRCERRILRTDRLEKIVAGAMKQSLKAYLPVVDALTPLPELLATSFNGLKLIAHCDVEAPRESLREILVPGEEVLILIGPEGDFSPEEVSQALAAGFRAVSLGGSRLRTETAALVAAHTVALLNE